PDTAFHNFPKRETAEIHLATNFQNMLYDHLPPALRDEIYAWLSKNVAGERKATDSDEQFFYKTRKKALGPFKRKFWDLDDATKVTLAGVYDQKFEFLFQQLAIGNTASMVAKFITPPIIHRPAPDGAAVAVVAAPDDPDAGE
ncbi:MAG: class II fructose-bisphosphate aldolase, partial [Gemmatimonadaceae bacterium]